MSNEIKFKSGLTWRSILACLYMLFVFTPALIYLQLVTVGVSIGGAIQVCTLLLFVEICRLSGKPLSRQEGALIYILAIMAGWMTTQWIDLIYREFFVLSPLLTRFGLKSTDIPTWWAPPPETGVWELRTFFHPAWSTPILILFASLIISEAGALFFGLFGREMFIEIERLPFPIQHIDAEAIITLTERHEDRLHILVGTSILSFIYGIILYTVPTATRAFGYPVVILPVPWFDFTSFIQRFFPGAALGIATDLLLVASGLVLPFRVVISMLIGSLGVFFFANWLFVHYGLTPWATRWTPGMDIAMIYRESTLYFWAGPVIGMSIAAGLMPVIMHPKSIVKSVKSIIAPKPSVVERRISGERMPTPLILSLFVIGCIGAIILDLILVPDFPVWALILYEIVFPFILCLTTIRIMGITGQSFVPPYMSQLTILLSGYQKYDAWFLPLQLNPGTWWTTNFKICQLTETSISSFIKGFFLLWPVSIFITFIFVFLFWQMAPIPSAVFPAPAIVWPVNIIYQAIWITRPKGLFNPQLILGFFGGVALLSVLFELAHIPLSIISIVVGAAMVPPPVITIFLGAVIGLIIARMKGKKWFDSYKTAIAAGITLGEGLAIVIGVAMALIARAIWIAPY